MDSQDVTPEILKALEELNQGLPASEQVPVSPDTQLFGRKGRLDSLGLVNLILLVEERVASTFGVSVTLADETAMSRRNSPFRNVRSLAEHVARLIPEKQDG